MADPFSYDSDIAPLRGNNFGGALSPAYFAQQNLDRQSMNLRREGMAVRIAEINQAAENQARNAQLEFDRANLAITETRRQIKNTLDMEQQLGTITPILNSIVENKDLDPIAQVSEIEKLRLQNSKFTVSNPSFNNVFNSAVESIQKRNASSEQVNQAAYLMAQDGDAEGVKNTFGGNVSSGAAKAFYDLAQSRTKKIKGISAGAAEEQKQQVAEKQRGDMLSSYNEQLKVLQQMEPESLDKPSQGGGAFGAAGTGDIKQTYSMETIKQLETIYRRLNPSKRKADLSGMSPEELYKESLEGTYTVIDELTGNPIQSTISKKSE
jgi:hypothetical protein